MSWTSSAIVLSTVLYMLAASPFLPASLIASDKDAIARGQLLFAQHCASCHGKDGKGGGPSASSQAFKPADMTQIEKRYGAFLAPQIESAIRGTNPALTHRAPNMVVWGAILRADRRGDRSVADARVRDLIAFVESIQEK